MQTILEFIRHLFGACGEGHFNLWHILPWIGTGFYLVLYNVKWCYKKGCSLCQRVIEQIKE